LPAAFLRWYWQDLGASPDEELTEAATAEYRRLRRSIILHGNELTAEQSLSTVFEALGIKIDIAAIAVGIESLMRETLAHAKTVPGAIETVESLANAGVSLGVVSSAVYHPFLEWSLERFEIADRFRVIVTSASCGYYKSRPEIYWSALAALGAEPDKSLHVGDSARFDVDGAHRAGMRTAWLTDDPITSPPASRPDLILATLQGSASGLYDQLGGHYDDRS
jgi:putative hydrolase of the HAD superfamily